MAIAFGGSDQISYGHVSELDGAAAATFLLRVYPINTSFYGAFLAQMSGGTDGVEILNESATEEHLFLGFRNGSSGPQKVARNVLTANAWNALWIVYPGGSPRAWIGSTEVGSWDVDTGGWPATLGTSTAPLTLGGEDGSLFNECRIADVAILFGRAVTDQALITAYANGASAQHFVRAGDFCAPLVRSQHDLFGRTGTLTNTSVVEHPRIVMRGKPWIARTPAAAPGGGVIPVFQYHYRRRRVA